MCALLSVGIVVSQSQRLFTQAEGNNLPHSLTLSGDLVAPQQNGMLDFRLGSIVLQKSAGGT
jgi:hypothetical protein